MTFPHRILQVTDGGSVENSVLKARNLSSHNSYTQGSRIENKASLDLLVGMF